MSKQLDRRNFLASSAAIAGGAVLTSNLAGEAKAADSKPYNLIIIGGGNAGMPAAIFAAQRGARVLIIEAAGQLGGTLHMSSGQMSAGGTKLQKSKGIEDSGQQHFDDVIRISKNTVDRDVVHLACMNAADTFDWLMDNGFDVHDNQPILGNTHEPYSRPRYAWGKSGGRSILRVLNAQLKPHIDSGKVTVLLKTKAKDLITDRRGAVTGVAVTGPDGKLARYSGENVLLTAGGCASNKEMFEAVDYPVKNYNDSSYPFSQGDGLMMGQRVGGFLRFGDTQLPMLGGILEDDSFPSPMIQTFRPFPPTRPPYEIYVNDKGQRFVQEDIPSHDALEEALKVQKDIVYWMVFDESIFWAAPQIMAARRYTREQYSEMFNNRPFFHKADTLEDLAKLAGFDPNNIRKTVEDYNRAVEFGNDAFGRKVMPLPLQQAPYYAIKCHGWKFMSFGGLAVNKDLQIITKEGKSVPNLYAAGEVLGAGATMGRSHVGGMCVTPALTLGRLLGQKMLKFNI